MEGFFKQMDRFLMGLSPPSLRSLAEDFRQRDVISQEEMNAVHDSAREEEARQRLLEILRNKRDPAKLRAVSQALQAFKSLFKQTQSQRESDTKKPSLLSAAREVRKEGFKSKRATEMAILSKFESETLSRSELEHLLQEASQSISLTSVTNFEGKSPLHLSCCLLTCETVRMLTEKYQLDVTATDNDGNTPLHDACRCQQALTVKFLLTLPQCDPNAQNHEGDTPLHEAVRNSNWAIARILLAHREAKVPVENLEGETPLTLVSMLLASPESKKVKKEMQSHHSMRGVVKVKQPSHKNRPAALQEAKKKIHFGDDINDIMKPSSPTSPVSPPPLPSPPPSSAKVRFTLPPKPNEPAQPGSVTLQSASATAASGGVAAGDRAPVTLAPTVATLRVPSPPSPDMPSEVPVRVTRIDDDVQLLEEEEDSKKGSGLPGFLESCLLDTPPVICVLVTLVIGIVLGLAIIIASGILLLA